MAPSDNESDLSEAPSHLSNPFTIAARSTGSSAILQNTRYKYDRRPVVPTVPKKTSLSHLRPPPRAAKDYSPLQEIPVTASGMDTDTDTDMLIEHLLEEEQEQQESQEPFMDSPSHTPGPSSSISQDSSNSSKRQRVVTSDIWPQAILEQRAIGLYMVCKHCRKAYKYSAGTKNMKDHLRKEHKWDPAASGVAQRRQYDGSSVDAAILRGADINRAREEQRKMDLLTIGVDKTTLEYLYIQWIVECDLPFHMVTHKAFRAMLEYISPPANQLLPSSGNTVKAHAFQLFAEGKQRLRHILATAISDIHITCDMWTSPNYLGILGVVGHYTSEKLERQAVTLALIEIEGEHSGENQAVTVLKVLKDFRITDKLGYFIMDNAYSNDTLVRVVADALKDEGVYYNYHERRLRCNGHVINLAVQSFLFGKAVDDYDTPETMTATVTDIQLNKWRKLGPLGKLHNIIVYIMASPQRIQAFKKATDGLMPHRDNGTRWNSWYEMLDWAIRKIKPEIITLTHEEPDLSNDLLSAEDWKTLVHIRDFLKGFYDTTKVTESKAATLDRVLPTMDFLIERFERAALDFATHDVMRESIQAGYTKMLKYWNKTERSPAYIAAIVLNPTMKYKYFDRWDPDWQPNMKLAMKNFWEKTYRSSTGMVQRSSEAEAESLKTDNQYLRWMYQIQGEQQDTSDELDRYLSEPLLVSNHGSAIDWWMAPEQRIRLPLLSKMAIDIYSIPAMSAEPERVFSGAKHTITDQRNSLKIETIELLECLKSWFRIGIFIEQDLHAIISGLEEA